MTYEEIKSEVVNIVKQAANNLTTSIPGGMDFWYGHTDLVRKYAIEFASKRNANIEIVELSAILHDYARFVDISKYGKIHAEKGSEFAREILSNLNYSPDKIECICDNILNHDKQNQSELNSLEGICLADADGYVHIVNCFEIYNALKIVKKPQNTKESLTILLNKIHESYNKMSPWGKDYAKTKYDYIVNYIKSCINHYNY